MTKVDLSTITWLIKFLLFLQLLQLAHAQDGSSPAPPNPSSIKQSFNPSMVIVMVALVSAFFLLGFFSVYIRHCAAGGFRGGGNFRLSPIGGEGRRSRAERGLDAAVIETFPTFTYSSVKGLKIGKGSLECAVCLNEFEDDETLRLLPKCNHVFHPDCVDAWLSSQSTCPVCRANLVPKPGDIPTAPIHIFDPDSELDEPEARPDSNQLPTEVLICGVNGSTRPSNQVKSPDVNFLTANHNIPRRTRSTGFRIPGIFSRSHTTGHSLVQAGENCDRFTLRLPEEVRSRILNSSLNRAKSCVAFPRVSSTRRGFRSGSSGGKNSFFYERFGHENRSGRNGLTITPPFFSRTGSIRSPMVEGTGEEVIRTQKSLSRSVKSRFDRLFLGMDRENNNVNKNVGERSFDRLRLDSQV